jgi:hypothetical protein
MDFRSVVVIFGLKERSLQLFEAAEIIPTAKELRTVSPYARREQFKLIPAFGLKISFSETEKLSEALGAASGIF